MITVGEAISLKNMYIDIVCTEGRVVQVNEKELKLQIRIDNNTYEVDFVTLVDIVLDEKQREYLLETTEEIREEMRIENRGW